MTKYEKFINIVFKIVGVLYLIETVLFLFDIYKPYKWGIAGNMLLISMFCLFVKYSNNKRENDNHD